MRYGALWARDSIQFHFSNILPLLLQSHECHNKLISDFVFLGSCSLVATGKKILNLNNFEN